MRRAGPRPLLLAPLRWLLALGSGCGPTLEPPAADAGAETSTADATVSSTTTASPTTAPDTPGTTSEDETWASFLVERDGLSVSFECDQQAQDCPAGEKCMPWANDGGGSWNATKCVPVVDDPREVGEPCVVEGSITSGIDDCEIGAMCWNVDTTTNQGICFDICIGPEANPFCDDPDTMCAISADAIIVCVPTCDPLRQDCPEDQICYPLQEAWACAPDSSGDMGGYGDPCNFIDECDPGLVCVDDSVVPPGLPCEGAAGCCTEICDLSDPAGDTQCTGAAEGQTCQAWYEDGAAPPGFENVGACALP